MIRVQESDRGGGLRRCLPSVVVLLLCPPRPRLPAHGCGAVQANDRARGALPRRHVGDPPVGGGRGMDAGHAVRVRRGDVDGGRLLHLHLCEGE